MTIRDIMKPVAWTIGPDDSLGTAERIMSQQWLHELIVVEDGAIAGLLSERDVIDYRTGGPDDWWYVPVRHAMQGIPATAHPDETIATAIDRLARSPFDVLPVVEQGILIGQITASDLFEAERAPVVKSPPPLTAAIR